MAIALLIVVIGLFGLALLVPHIDDVPDVLPMNDDWRDL